jgi:hypothetical protein
MVYQLPDLSSSADKLEHSVEIEQTASPSQIQRHDNNKSYQQSTTDKRRNKLQNRRTSVACGMWRLSIRERSWNACAYKSKGQCRRRKVRCRIVADPQGRCGNCIRLKMYCSFSSEHQQPWQTPISSLGLTSPSIASPIPERPRSGSRASSFGSCASGISHPPRSGNWGAISVGVGYDDLEAQSRLVDLEEIRSWLDSTANDAKQESSSPLKGSRERDSDRDFNYRDRDWSFERVLYRDSDNADDYHIVDTPPPRGWYVSRSTNRCSEHAP